MVGFLPRVRHRQRNFVASPILPAVPSKNTKLVHLLKGFGVGAVEMMRRRCERQTGTRRAACPVFWTLGGNQVGKAAISGWRDVVQPARKAGALLWPFDGDLAALSKSGRLVICETYPAEAYGHVGVRFRSGASKRKQTSRREAAASVSEWASCYDVAFSEGLRSAIADGFGPLERGEDPFDAALGLFGMIEVVDGRRQAAPPSVEAIECEGWYIGPERMRCSGLGSASPSLRLLQRRLAASDHRGICRFAAAVARHRGAALCPAYLPRWNCRRVL